MVLKALSFLALAGATVHAQSDSLNLPSPLFQNLDTLTVEAKISKIPSPPTGTSTLQREEFKTVPGTLNDPLRAIFVLPGVESANDLSLLPFVRGGDFTETRLFWNEIPLLNPFHSMTLFSIFPMEGVENMVVNSGFLPASGQGSLSGSIWAKSRNYSDHLQGLVSVDWMRTGAGVQIPLNADWAMNISGQYFYYDLLLKSILHTSTWFSGDSSFSANVDQYSKFVQLPTFFDANLGLQRKLKHGVLSLDQLWSGDRFHVLDQRDQWSGLDSILKMDTLAWVQMNNFAQKLNWEQNLQASWKMQSSLAWQWSKWDVHFLDAADSMRFNENKAAVHAKQKLEYSGAWWTWVNGWNLDYFYDNYDCHLIRPVYKLLMEPISDPMDLVGQINPNGMVLSSDMSSSELIQMFSTLNMFYQSHRSHTDLSLFSQWEGSWSPVQKWSLGLRLEQEFPDQFSLSPRAQWKYKLPTQWDLALSTGLYTQREYPFYYWASNPKLQSEKSWNTDLELSKNWSKDLQFKWALWTKKYWDLVAIKVLPIQFNTMESISADDFNAAKNLMMDNSGSGMGWGSELSSEYHPFQFYRGRISAEWGHSQREDDLSSRSYPFYRFRDWKLKWFHYFQFGEKNSIAFKFNMGKGFPYTGYRTSAGGDSLIIEPRLNRNYTNYQRLDLRFAHKAKFMELETESYFEIWNALNSPNAFLRDSESKEIRNMDLNMPIPFIFGGWEIHF